MVRMEYERLTKIILRPIIKEGAENEEDYSWDEMRPANVQRTMEDNKNITRTVEWCGPASPV